MKIFHYKQIAFTQFLSEFYQENKKDTKMKFCNNCAVPESKKCDALKCPSTCNGAENVCPCFNAGCAKAGTHFYSDF